MLNKKQTKQFLESLTIKPKIDEKGELTQRVLLYAREYSKTLDLAHNFSHLSLVLNTSLKLLDVYSDRNKLSSYNKKQIEKLLSVATFLHDCDSKKYPSDTKDKHAIQCAKKAGSFLSKHIGDENFIHAIEDIVSCHDSTGYKAYFDQIESQGRWKKKNIQLASRILYDSDKLQTIGLLGYIRVIQTNFFPEDADSTEIYAYVSQQIKKCKLSESSQIAHYFGKPDRVNKENLHENLRKLDSSLRSL